MRLVAGLIVAVAASPRYTGSSHGFTSGGCSGTDFDYELLVLQHPGGWSHPPEAEGNPFTLHGLWPSRETSCSYPCNCTHEKFDFKSLPTEMQHDMEVYWKSSQNNNEGFWAHEWSKHGTCAKLGSQQAFFKTALEKRAEFSDALLGAFKEAGMEFDKPISAQKLHDAAWGKGLKVLLGCAGGKDAQVLDSVGLCLNTTLEDKTCASGMLKCGGSYNDCALDKDVTIKSYSKSTETLV